jgi:Fe-S cluster assembly iron-binding protein IscA
MSTVEVPDEPPARVAPPAIERRAFVLTLTDSALTAVQSLTTQAGLPDATGGLRIAQQDAGGFELALVPEPLPGDDVVTDGSTRVYVDPEASATLADQRLDVEPVADGTAFTLTPQ